MISGATKLLVIIGDPIAQVRSPVAFNARFAASGQDAVLVPWHAPEVDFGPVMTGLMRTSNLAGIIVTYPFKQRALDLAASVATRAAQVGATNALRREPDGRWTADMFDGVGLVRGVHGLGQSLAGRCVLLLGAGGAGGAIAFALAAAGVARLSIYDTDDGRASSLAERVGRACPDCDVRATGPSLDGADLLINATPVGLAPDDPMPIALPTLSSETTVIDIVTRPEGTRLLEFARAKGCPHAGGNVMVDGQIEALTEFFGFASLADREHAA